MFALWLILWEAPIVIIILLANQDHLLTMKQAQAYVPYHGMKVAVLSNHRGIIGGDILLVSPICAWMLAHYEVWWKNRPIGIAVLVAGVCSGLMLYVWANASKKNHLVEPFNHLGSITVNGWVHGAYMLAALTVIFLFFFATPHLSMTFAWVAIVGLGVHITVGLIQPEYHTYGTVSMTTIAIVIGVWAVLLGRGMFLTDR